MTERTGAVYDLGYVPYEGERHGRSGALASTLRDGVQRVFGIKRRARKKILPWMLIVFGITPSIVFVGLSFLLSDFSPQGGESPFASHAEYFTLIGSVVFLFVALSAPELLIPDRKEGVLQIYSSRPLRADDYVWARCGGLALVLAVFLLLPHALMYIGFAALGSDGFFEELVGNADQLWRILLTTLVYVAGFAPLALAISTFTNRKAVASGIFIAGIPVLSGVGSALIEATDLPGHDLGGLLALSDHPLFVRDWIFGRAYSDLAPVRAGFDPWLSLGLIVLVAAVSLVLVVWRYRRLM